MEEGANDDKDHERFIIAFSDCNEDEINKFLEYLDQYKHLKFKTDFQRQELNGKQITFVEIQFSQDFIKKSEYLDRHKFQLEVKKQKSNDEEQNLLGNGKQQMEPRRGRDDSIFFRFETISRVVDWIKKSSRQREDFLANTLETFELRRNNIEWFHDGDVEGYLIRGTILSSIIHDEMEFIIENYLKIIRNNIKNSENSDEVIEIIEKENDTLVMNYRKRIEDMIRKSDKIEQIKDFIQSEIEKYENYNRVRSKVSIFPLHKTLGQEHPLHKWTALKNSLGRQPLCEIKNYFGVKVATYFAWAGFYTYMLIIASIFGLICCIFGLTIIPYSRLSRDICTSEVIMCPRCDKWCDFWELKDTCSYAIIHHAIDNFATIVFTVFMSIWSALYLIQWKRYIAQYNAKWDVIDLDDSCHYSRRNYIQNVRKLHESQEASTSFISTDVKIPKTIKIYRLTLSFVICILWVLLSLGMVFALLLYRMSLITSERIYGNRNSYSIYVVPISTALLNLLGIQVLNYLYEKIAVHLTKKEFQRTEVDYENSLSVKLFMFQFVNYYSAIFYIAIFKGKFIGSPAKYTRVFGFRQEECNPGGCFVELVIQLAIIMTGRQAIKLCTPYLWKMYARFNEKKVDVGNETLAIYISNYNLKEFNFMTLMPEYLEMVIQFGFVTLFVAAFPLAPLFALINNILEVRLDGRKFLLDFRRPLPSRVKGIGVWLNIMSVLTRIATASNAVIIAFSSHFIPKLVYRMSYSSTHTFQGYLNHSLAPFYTKDFEPEAVPRNSAYNISTCYYLQYRTPPDGVDGKYQKHIVYWHVMAIRLTFIVFYQFFISLIVIALENAIPSVPKKVKKQMKIKYRYMLEMEKQLSK